MWFDVSEMRLSIFGRQPRHSLCIFAPVPCVVCVVYGLCRVILFYSTRQVDKSERLCVDFRL